MPAFTTEDAPTPNAATKSPTSDPDAPPTSRISNPASRISDPTPDPNAPPASRISPLEPRISDQDRYSRQILFRPIGAPGQQLLARAHVAIVGVGATGAATASLLARAGVGRLTLIDRDFVEPSNLQRQMLFDEDDARASLPKAEAARRHLARINSSIHLEAHIADLIPQNAPTLLNADIVLDCTDNFETRYLINDLCVRDHRPWIYAAAVGAYAATMNILPRAATDPHHTAENDRHPDRSQGPLYLQTERSDLPLRSTLNPLSPATSCLACIFPSAPTGNVDTCDTAGILSTAVNLAASLQVTEALKYLTHQPEAMRRTLLSFDLWQNTRSEINTSTPRPDCEVCNGRIFRHLAGDQRPHITLCGRNSVQIHQHHHPLNLAELETRLAPLGPTRANGLLLRFTYDPYTLTVFPDGRALIQGTTDPALARSLYARFVGS